MNIISILSDTQFCFLLGRSTLSNVFYTGRLIHKEVNSGDVVDKIYLTYLKILT